MNNLDYIYVCVYKQNKIILKHILFSKNYTKVYKNNKA